MKRKIVIGDIHGALKAVEQLFGRIDLRPDDRLIFLGDYVDGWSESAQVVNYLMELGKKMDCVFIKGNHDVCCERWLKSLPRNDEWVNDEGRATVESYSRISGEDIKLHVAFFDSLKYYYTDDENRLFIHAGFSSMHGPAKEEHAGEYVWDRSLWEMALVMDPGIAQDSKLYPRRLSLYKEIYIGHTPTINFDSYTPMQAVNVWNIDTGAAFSGKLSAMDIDTKEVWQSDTVQDLYPQETGRQKQGSAR